MNEKKVLTIKDLYPDMTDDEARVAEANLQRYLGVVLRISVRRRRESAASPVSAAGNLTAAGESHTMPSPATGADHNNPQAVP